MANVLEIIVRAKDEASKTLQDVEKQVGLTTKQMAIAGGIMVAAGTAITGALALTAKAAAEEEAGIVKLSTAMGNMGISYDGVRGSLEKWINTQQQKTAFADGQQRESLSSLITVTGNLTQAQNLLTIAMDLARWKDIDLGTATDILARVYAGNMGTLSRYGIVLKEGATATEALAEIQRLSAGQADAYGKSMKGQFELLQNNIDDLKEAIGAVLLPIFTPLIKNLNDVVQGIKAWTDAHPALMRAITVLVGATGIIALIGGITLLAKAFMLTLLPSLIAIVTALWAQVTATIAAVAATGYGIPIAIASAAAIGMLAFGIQQLASRETEQIATTKDSAKDQEALMTSVAGTTEQIEAQTEATKELTRAMEAAFAAARSASEQPAVSAPFYDAAHRAAAVKEAEEWERRAEEAAAAGRVEEAGFAAQQAAQLSTRLQSYQKGGIVRETGLAYLHRGETVIPTNANITIPVYLDGELITTRVERRMMNRIRLQGVA